MLVIWKGIETIKFLEGIGAPFMLGVGLLLLWWITGKAGGFGPVLSASSKFQTTAEFFHFFVPSLTAMVGFWATVAPMTATFKATGTLEGIRESDIMPAQELKRLSKVRTADNKFDANFLAYPPYYLVRDLPSGRTGCLMDERRSQRPHLKCLVPIRLAIELCA